MRDTPNTQNKREKNTEHSKQGPIKNQLRPACRAQKPPFYSGNETRADGYTVAITRHAARFQVQRNGDEKK